MHKYSYHLTPVSNRCLAYTTLRAHLLRYQFQSLLEHAIRGPVPPSLGPDKITVCCSVQVAVRVCLNPPGRFVRVALIEQATLLVIEHNRLFLVVFSRRNKRRIWSAGRDIAIRPHTPPVPALMPPLRPIKDILPATIRT